MEEASPGARSSVDSPSRAETFRLGLIADIHLAPAGTPPARFNNDYLLERGHELLERALDECRREAVDAIAVLGDLTHLGDNESLTRVQTALRDISLSVWMVLGNHDQQLDSQTANTRGVLQIGQPYTAAAEDWMIPIGARVAGSNAVRLGSNEWASTPPTMRAWGSELVLWLSHFPVISRQDAVHAAELRYAGDSNNAAQIHQNLRQRTAPTLAVCGHLHLRDACADGPLLQLACPALIEPPLEFVVLEIEREAHEWRVHAHWRSVANDDGYTKLPILLHQATASWQFDSRVIGWTRL